MYEEIIFFL